MLAHKLCQSKSAPLRCGFSIFSWKGCCVVTKNLSSAFYWLKVRGKVMLRVSFGTKMKSLYMDRLEGVFCKEVNQEKLGLGSICRAGTPQLALCL